MKKLFQPVLTVLSIAAIFTSCKNNVPKEAKYIPKETSVVLVLDPQQLQDKLQKGGISIDTLIGRIFNADSSEAKDKAQFDDLRNNSGIDWNNKVFFFAQQKTNPDKSQSNIFSLMSGLKDAAKLEAYIKKQDHFKNKEVKKEKEYSYISLHDGALLAWNDQEVIATMYTRAQKPSFDTATMTLKQPEPTNNNDAELKAQVAHYFTQKVSESLADVKYFTDMFKDKSDGYMFTSANSSLAALSMMPLQLPKLEELLKDNYSAYTLNFEDGKIVAKGNTYTNKMLSDILKQYAGPVVDLSLIENYPSQNINSIILASFNPEIFGGVLKQLEVEGLANSFLNKAGLSSQDLYKSLKGNIAVVVSDLSMPSLSPEPQMKPDEKPMIHKNSFGKMLFNAQVGDKASFFKLMDKAAEQGFLIKQGNVYKAGGLLATMGLFINADEHNLIISSDSVTYTQYMAKTTKAVISQDVLDHFKNKSMVFYFDIDKTINGVIKDPSLANAMGFDRSSTALKNTFKDMISTVDNFDGSMIKGSFEVRMKNEKQNSLVTLTSLLTDIAVDMHAKSKKDRETEEKMFPGGVPAIIRTN